MSSRRRLQRRALQTLRQGVGRLLGPDEIEGEFDGLADALFSSWQRTKSVERALRDAEEWYQTQLEVLMPDRLREGLRDLMREWCKSVNLTE
jgi:predicted RNase H-like HicB family nuclease